MDQLRAYHCARGFHIRERGRRWGVRVDGRAGAWRTWREPAARALLGHPGQFAAHLGARGGSPGLCQKRDPCLSGVSLVKTLEWLRAPLGARWSPDFCLSRQGKSMSTPFSSEGTACRGLGGSPAQGVGRQRGLGGLRLPAAAPTWLCGCQHRTAEGF